ncbi:hypothetical protein RQM65_12315 [Pricia sp. S334]|uniref:Uncharacterized protein n=1 Tax=Pricia mediterranea TaxID=3076079 RepID=A0ABU3L8Q9_9FLAO|nr:hypothetical protein [Pricia sp. S334]MDT7829452.1 hypothetical protein [Pricia sp. S334]
MPDLRTYSVAGKVYASPNGADTLLDTNSLSVNSTDQVGGDSSGRVVQGLMLVNADTDQDIGEIIEGGGFNHKNNGTSNLDIRAEPSADAESVVFDYQGEANYHTENVPVYAIGGNSNCDYWPWIANLGTNTLTAIAYAEDRGAASAG